MLDPRTKLMTQRIKEILLAGDLNVTTKLMQLQRRIRWRHKITRFKSFVYRGGKKYKSVSERIWQEPKRNRRTSLLIFTWNLV